jgi:DUF2934 family protein
MCQEDRERIIHWRMAVEEQNASKDVDITLMAVVRLLTGCCLFSLYTWLEVSRKGRNKKMKTNMELSQSDRIHAQIAIRAYQRWEKRGRPTGSHEEDWVHAEEELRVLLDVQRPPFSSISMGAATG